MSFSTIFPAPGTLINAAGQLDELNGLPAPGFSGLGVSLQQDTSLFRARSGRGLTIEEDNKYWSFLVSYNDMTQKEYLAIESFMLSHNTKVNPFYITLPNYSKPQNDSFFHSLNSGDIAVDTGVLAGDRNITITSSDTSLIPGCFINLIDDADALHKRTYKVVRVETPTSYSGDAVPSGKIRLHLFPEVQRDFSGNVTARFIKPKFRVVQTSELEVDYDENGIAKFQFRCTEILP